MLRILIDLLFKKKSIKNYCYIKNFIKNFSSKVYRMIHEYDFC